MSAAPAPSARPWSRWAALGVAFGLALAAAVSLGLARFSYALLLPPMRDDLGWSYFTAGLMNTLNAVGYLAGALAMPRLLARFDARWLMLLGGTAAAVLLALHGLTRSDALLGLLRLGCGVASAFSFVGGGLLAARLATAVQLQTRLDASEAPLPGSGLLLGLYYGGTGLGIVVSALLLPPLLSAGAAHWPSGWGWLGCAALAATLATAASTGRLHAPPQPGAPRMPVRWAPMGWALAGYGLFGLGYIGYMTFIVTLLRERGMPGTTIAAFYVLLGVGVVASSFLWARLLQRRRDGGALARLNGLLALATALPVVLPSTPAVFASGLLFGSVFLSVVASTTALVRHNLPAALWPAGIAAFTIVFAGGQIVGPSLVGWLADGPGGLARGLAASAAALALGAALALRQRPLGIAPAAA